MTDKNKATLKGVRQRRTRFIKEYLVDQNATRSAIAAGFSEKGARVTGSRLLTEPNIAAEINKRNAELNEKYDLSADRIKQELARLCFSDPGKLFNADGSAKPITDLDEDSRRAIAGFEVAELFTGSGEERAAAGYIKKYKFVDKVRAVEVAARVQKLLVDRVEVTGLDALAEALAKARQRAK